MKPDKNISVAYGCLLVAMVLWASTFIALKIAFKAYDPMVVIFGRMLIASCCVVFVPFVFKSVKTVRRRDIKLIALMALCEPCLYFIFEAKALVYTSASQAGMISTMMPLITAFGAWIFLKEQITPRTGIGFAVAAAGALWLSLASTPSAHGPNPLLGNFPEFLAMVCAAGYGLCLKRLTSRYHPIFLAFVQAFAGTLFYLPILFSPAPSCPPTWTRPPPLPWSTWAPWSRWGPTGCTISGSAESRPARPPPSST